MTARRGRNPAAAVVSHRPWSPSPTRSSRRTPAACGSIRWFGCAGLPSPGRAPPSPACISASASRCRSGPALPSSRLGRAQPRAAPPLSGEPPARRQCGDAAPRLRHPPARGAALPDRRAAEPVRDAVPRAGPDLGDGAARRERTLGARPPRGRLGDASSSSSTGRCRGFPAQTLDAAASSTSTGIWTAILLGTRLHRHLCLARRRGGAPARPGARRDRAGARPRAAPVPARRPRRRGGPRARHAARDHRARREGARPRRCRRTARSPRTSGSCASRSSAAATS